MSNLITFVQVGFRHIVDIEAMDHILFLVALAAIYRVRDVRGALWVITAFTVGHSVSLALAVTNVVRFPSAVIEFLIPVTIVATGVENLVVSARRRAAMATPYRPVLAGVFGLVHGAGFANYLRALFVSPIAVPLFGFNVGIELGQLVVLTAAALFLAAVDWILARVPLSAAAWSPMRLRVAGVSAIVVAIASRWAIQRVPW